MLAVVAGLILVCTNGSLSVAGSTSRSISAAETDLEAPLYTPPKKLSPRARIGGRLRGTEGSEPEVQAIVPDHVGFTVKEKPTLNWFLSKPTSHKVMFTLVNTEEIRPIYEAPLPGPATEGFHSIDLQTLGISLEPDVQYRWHVSVERDANSRSQDIVAGGVIERCEFSACLAEVQPNLSCN